MEWIAAKPHMLNVIKLKIEPVISRELSEEIIEELRDDDLSDINKTIIDNLKFAFANFVTGKADEGYSYLYRIRKKLMATPDNFPAWKTSETYKAILESTANKYNTDRKIFRAGF
jgi:acyl-CoA reductase-like NAD-dependent aldehyde dehydrogenase